MANLESALDKAEKFIREATQFRLGALVTESPHPVSRNLSQTAREDAARGLGVLFEVDRDVVEKFRQWIETPQPRMMCEAMLNALEGGGNLFFTGCGSTGRLSIQLVSIWREFWQNQRFSGKAALADQYENRAFSVMAGGDFALIKAVEGFEDFTQFGHRQIADLGLCAKDAVFAITEGGETSFVIGTAWEGVERGANVFFVYNNPDDILCQHVERSRQVIQEPRITKINLTTGPMAITGSTRMQATTIQLAVLLTVFEMVLQALLGNADDSNLASIPARVLLDLEAVYQTLSSPQYQAQLGALVKREEEAYRAGRKNTYYASAIATDVLTDTTERSPTYCIPAFRKFDDTQAAESWSFIFLPAETTEDAWRILLHRELQPVEWSLETVRELIGEELAERQYNIIRQIGREEILRFRIGKDGQKYRPLNPDDCATAICTASELSQLGSVDGFFQQQLKAADQAGARISLVFAGTSGEIRLARDIAAQTLPNALGVYLTLPETPLLLNPALRLGVKMSLNALSTCTLVRMGRVMGNIMIWVVPSNLKLIDRSTRYISQLAEVSYEDACRMLFEVIEYVSPRMQAGQAYPAPVGVSVMRLRYGLGNEEAEARLLQETS